ncbi:MAG: hypothetical protein DMF63_04650 [Acidobacteria bacterium]|nr:MAG: hypothetical protein DMF63_04650 [Acidobacteriota bacterium]
MLRNSTIMFAVLAILYVAVRVWHLDAACLWFDEIFSVHAAEHDWNSLFWFVAQDLIHPPLFYAVLKVWIGIGGESVFWLRLLSVLFSTLAIVPFLYLCKELKLSNAVALLALVMLAVNGSLIKYTQTVRMYTMLMFLSLVSLWLFARYFNRGKSFAWLLIVNLFLVYTHYFGWLVVGAEIVALLAFQLIKWRRMLTMVGVLVVAFVPWMIAVLKAAEAGSDVGQNISWMTRPGPREMLTFVFDLTEPFYFQASNVEPASIYWVSIPIVLILFIAITFFFVSPKREDDKQVVGLLALFAIVPAAAAFVASWILPHSVWGTRHLIVIYAPAAILLAYFVTRIPVAFVRTGAVTLLLLFCASAFVLQAMRPSPRYVWCAWNDVAGEIRKREPLNVYSFENLVAYHLWFALRDSDQFKVSVVKGVDVRTDDESYFLPRGFDKVRTVPLEDIKDEKLWVAFRTSVDGEDAPIISSFEKLGYVACPRDGTRFDSTTVFWLEMRKGHESCE